jgi:calcineurin-like phosphoesterase family protein
MNEALIDNWNKKVTKQDIVYFLGDFALGLRYQ